ncbi:MAG: Sec-independent protein translocase protein TatB [Gammaproteobacteria bacterium]|nr:twin-arginine translocase subunit TatB [Rhodocyclaceae bacterium]MBU3908243.1 Sec-independent protein translocase protein TatB [Gammaproteobacteria bacterium]MBU3990505.1 Sec-independent protein translocase protein TatB [Gammaproteobacteria bacterium]MBU4003120.1 Sec-independent protein translocase protein TatB [Gammaproteobacteria bacterium]MBU4019962.1 Sec-independent protein translocase protein TatB [Gammaproteobacteria bacterium]
MFDIGFTELMLIALVGLIVIGPERMPKVARTVGHLLGRLQRYVGDVKADIKREMQLDELKKLQSDVAAQAHDMESRVNEQMKETETSLTQSILPSGDVTIPAPAENAPSESPTRTPPTA